MKIFDNFSIILVQLELYHQVMSLRVNEFRFCLGGHVSQKGFGDEK